MTRINKTDYFMGVFLNTIVKYSKERAINFKTSENTKIVEFTTQAGDFKIYIKYSTSLEEVEKKIGHEARFKSSCNFLFFDSEYNYLKDSFYSSEKINLLGLVFTNDRLTKTHIALISLEDAMDCLREKTRSGLRRISIYRLSGEPYFYCYGVGFKDYEHIRSPVDFTNLLGLDFYDRPYEQLRLL